MIRKKSIWKTKLKITNTFLIFFLVIFAIVIILNMCLFSVSILNVPNISQVNPETFTRNFKEYLNIDEKSEYVSDKGKNLLAKNNAWLQILDNNLKEEYSVYKPQNIPKQYELIDLIHAHKYDVENNTIFISKKDNSNKVYIIGFPIKDVAKHTLIFNPPEGKNILKRIIFVFIIDILAIILLAYAVLARRFANPINNIIKAINDLVSGDYETKYPPKGIYKSVFYNLNLLSDVLNKSMEERKEVEKLRNEWISSISHDLKTPLASIKGFSEIMKSPNYNFSEDEIKNYSKIIWDKSIFIQLLIEDLNLTNKLKNKLIPLKLKKVNMKEFISKIVSQILNEPIYCEYKILFRYDISEGEINLNVDKQLMERAIVNLILNSIKHNDKNTIVEVILSKTDSINIIIRDNGKGIEKEDLKHIFKRYYRGTNTSSSTEGSGLGMAIAKEIVHLHKGEIIIDSTVNKGTTVTIRFNNV